MILLVTFLLRLRFFLTFLIPLRSFPRLFNWFELQDVAFLKSQYLRFFCVIVFTKLKALFSSSCFLLDSVRRIRNVIVFYGVDLNVFLILGAKILLSN